MSDDQKDNFGSRPRLSPNRGPRRKTQKARLIEKAREVVYQTPEVRPEKVARLKEAIERGAYEIDTEKLADIILKEWFPKR
jgi:flagellar biosynthesis anti-sigma factor FlgM